MSYLCPLLYNKVTNIVEKSFNNQYVLTAFSFTHPDMYHYIIKYSTNERTILDHEILHKLAELFKTDKTVIDGHQGQGIDCVYGPHISHSITLYTDGDIE